MLRTRFLVILLAAVATLYPSTGYGMERAAMDQLLTLSRTRPDSPEFREALLKHLGEAPIKSGEAYNSNGPDFVWAVESATQPALTVDDQPAGPMRRIAGSNLWFYVAQLGVGTSHRFHYVVNGAKFGGCTMCPVRTALVRAGGRPAGAAFRKARPCQQAVRRHGDELLDLRARAI